VSIGGSHDAERAIAGVRQHHESRLCRLPRRLHLQLAHIVAVIVGRMCRD